MINMNVSIEGGGFDDWIAEINKTSEVIEADLNQLADQALEFMHSSIKASTTRAPATGTLINAIKIEKVDEEGYLNIGIGKISELPIYWYVLNYGAKFDGTLFVPGNGKTVHGNFGGGGMFQQTRGERFNYEAGSKTVVKAKNPNDLFGYIKPRNYIENTYSYILTLWDDIAGNSIEV